MAPYLITYFVFKCEKIYRGQKVAANQRLYDSPLCSLCLHKQCHLFFIALDKTHNTQNSNTHLLKALSFHKDDPYVPLLCSSVLIKTWIKKLPATCRDQQWREPHQSRQFSIREVTSPWAPRSLATRIGVTANPIRPGDDPCERSLSRDSTPPGAPTNPPIS